ncbi:beta-lactamase-like protein, partial [Phlebopus sp. FC_14]
MPDGTPYHSFALPYPIRVDNFTSTIDDLVPPYNRPALHLLTHVHADHVKGLASKTFTYRVVCSPDTKEMLLRHEVYAERFLHDHEYRPEKGKTFGHLKVDPYVTPTGYKHYTGSRDLLHAIPLNTPTEFALSDNETVIITLIDANHCPGAAMFLIEGPRGSILHTGDVRAEAWFLSSLLRSPFLQPYLADSADDLRIFVARQEGMHPEDVALVRTLEVIYLDTASLFSTVVIPSKEHAVQGLVELIALFPSNTYFFLNSWTWGYEDILKGVARAFHCKVHLDRYKHTIYSHLSDPFLRALGTRDASSTRFHACERFDRCSFVDVPHYDFGCRGAVTPLSKEGKKVVYVNPVTMSCARWETYKVDVRRRVLKGEILDSLLVPLSRHSPLPELMNFVALFRPRRVIPNTLDPSLGGLDWGAMRRIFEGCLSTQPSPNSPF